MIYDKIENINEYKGINSRLDIAIDKVLEIYNDQLIPGKYELKSNEVFYMVDQYRTIPTDQGKYESHEKYIDIQFIQKGSEVFRFSPKEDQETTVPYNSDKDIEFYKLSGGLDLNLIPGRFVIVMPDELHAPKLQADIQEDVNKVVFKILK